MITILKENTENCVHNFHIGNIFLMKNERQAIMESTGSFDIVNMNIFYAAKTLLE